MGETVQTSFRYFPVSPRDEKWGLYVTTAGQSHIPPHTGYPPGGHPKDYAFDWRQGRVLADHQVIYISSGRGWFESRGTGRRPIESGDVFLLFPGVWHRYAPDPATGWDEHWVGCAGEIVTRLLRHGFFSAGEPVLRIAREDSLLGVFAEIMEAVEVQPPALQQVLAGLASRLLSLVYSASRTGPSGAASDRHAVREAMRILHGAPEARHDLPGLARRLGASYTSFRRAFARQTGMGPHQYLLQLRIAHARTLLAGGGRSVKEIAAECGFEGEPYFCRLFKKRTGLTPGQWRARSHHRGDGAG